MTEAEWMATTDVRAMLAAILPTRSGDAPPVHMGGGLGGISPRKLRRFAIELFRRDPGPLDAAWYAKIARQAEALADGETTREEVYATEPKLSALWCVLIPDAADTCRQAIDVYRLDDTVAAALLRDIVGNPFHVLPIWRNTHRPGMGSMTDYLTDWVTPTVLSLAQAAYDERGRKCKECHGKGKTHDAYPGGWSDCEICQGTGQVDDGTLDPERLLVLSDALEEAGCDNEILLRHLRGEEQCSLMCEPSTERYHNICRNTGWIPLRGSHVRGCWAIDLLLGKE